MQPNPLQSDPQPQSPYQPHPEQQSPPGMQSQTDVPPQSGTNVNAQPAVAGAGQRVPPESVVQGADVFGMDGKTMGTVREVYNDSFLVQKGVVFPHDYYIPYRYVAKASDDEVNLTLMSHEAQSQDWSQRPSATSGAQTSPDYGTDYGTQQGVTTLLPGETPPYGDYGRAGSSDTMQDASNRGLQDDLGGAPEPSNADPDQWELDAQGMRDF